MPPRVVSTRANCKSKVSEKQAVVWMFALQRITKLNSKHEKIQNK